MKRVICFNEGGYLEYPLEQQVDINKFKIKMVKDKIIYLDEKGNETNIVLQKEYKINKHVFTVLGDNTSCFLKESKSILIGQLNADINISLGQYIIDENTIIFDNASKVYVNGKQCLERKIRFIYGDQILINNNILLIINKNFIKIIAEKESYDCHLSYVDMSLNMGQSFPEYKRSPRIIKKLKSDKINISKPPNKVNRKKNSLVKVIVPPVVMAFGTVALSLMMGRGLYMLIGLAGTLVSLVFSVTTYFSDKK